MVSYKLKVVEFEGQICLVFPDEMCRESNIKVGDPVDVGYDDTQDRLIIKLLK